MDVQLDQQRLESNQIISDIQGLFYDRSLLHI